MRVAFAAAALAALFVPAAAEANTVIAGGNIINQTWTLAGSPYRLQGDVTVPAGAFLTIQAGVVVEAQANSDGQASGVNTSRTEITVAGTLTVQGTAAQPVTFRSTSTTSGTWYGVIVGAAAEAVTIDHAVIEDAIIGLTNDAAGTVLTARDVTVTESSSYGFHVRAGSPTLERLRSIANSNAGVRVDGSAAVTLTGCVIRNNSSYGVYFASTSGARTLDLAGCTINANSTYGVITTTGSTGTVTITNTIITNHSYGVYRNDSSTISTTYSNVWRNTSGNFGNGAPATGVGLISANPLYVSTTDLRLTANSPSRFGASGGGHQGALAYDGAPAPALAGTLWTSVTLTAAASPHTVTGDVTVPEGITLTLEPGATLQFSANTDLMESGTQANRAELIVAGTLLADGTPAAPITLRSTSTTSGTWYGVDVRPSATGLVIDNVIVQDAIVGLTYRATAAGNAITRSTFTESSSYGLHLRAGSPTLDSISSIGNSNAGIRVDESAAPTLTNCVVRNNSSYGVYFSSTSGARTLDLVNCTINANSTYGVITTTGSTGTVTITNSIITNHSYGVYRNDSSTISTTYSDVWNNTSGNFGNGAPANGVGVISANPLYVSATDLRLTSTSVAIDAGTTGPSSDAVGAARPLDGNGIGGAQWDLGAYEFVLVAACGNGVLEPPEVCDSGLANGTYGNCNATCTGDGPRCGDGMVNGPEECDDGNTSNTDACLNTCKDARCGDGFVHEGVEACDDGNDINTDACNNQCVSTSCGNGVVDSEVEECDDGNADNRDACTNACLDARCGDGYVHTGVEACDDGNTEDGDGCSALCEVEPGGGPGGDGGPGGGATDESATGCCDTRGAGAPGSAALALVVVLALRRRRAA